MEILTQVEQGIGWLSLNRPSMRNAISKSMWDELPRALRSLQGEGAQVIIFQGEGQAFSAGADLWELELLDSQSKAEAHWLSIRDALNAVAACPLPTVAMINGPCMGGGCLLACACDLRYCDSNAKFAVPVAALGIVLDDANIARLLSLVGRGATAEMLLTAMPVEAARAAELGLVNRVVPPNALHAHVTKIALQIAKNSPAALKACKTSLAGLSGALAEQEQAAMIASYLSPDFRSRVGQALAKGRPE